MADRVGDMVAATTATAQPGVVYYLMGHNNINAAGTTAIPDNLDQATFTALVVNTFDKLSYWGVTPVYVRMCPARFNISGTLYDSYSYHQIWDDATATAIIAAGYTVMGVML